MGANAQTSVPAFTAGQVLTAQQQTEINTGVPVFADSTARDAAFGGTGEKVLAEGQLAYLENSNVVQYYDGSVWATVGPSTTFTWTTYTPTITNGSLGNGTLAARYAQSGNYVVVKILFTLGSTSTIGTSPNFSLPVTADSTASTVLVPAGFCLMEDTGVKNYVGLVRFPSTTTVEPFPVSGTPIEIGGISAASPFTWGNGDKLALFFSYEAA